MHFNKNIFEKPIAKKLSLWYNTAVMKNAGVAQWQSSGIVNRRLQVRLLSPAPLGLVLWQTPYGGIPERPKGADCKSVVTDFGGPNPPSPTKKRQALACRFFN